MTRHHCFVCDPMCVSNSKLNICWSLKCMSTETISRWIYSVDVVICCFYNNRLFSLAVAFSLGTIFLLQLLTNCISDRELYSILDYISYTPTWWNGIIMLQFISMFCSIHSHNTLNTATCWIDSRKSVFNRMALFKLADCRAVVTTLSSIHVTEWIVIFSIWCKQSSPRYKQ